MRELCRLNSLYQRMMSPAEIASCADMFTEALAGESVETVARAFSLHVKHARRFPCPGDIQALLPEARVWNGWRKARAAGKRTPGFGNLIAALFHRRLPCMELGLGRAVLERMAADGVDPETCGDEVWDRYI